MTSIFRGPFRHLTREEEIELSTRAQRGDERARQELATSNIPLVVSVARKYRDDKGQFDDIVQEGTIGLLKAIERFDPKKGVRFATYAVWWIRAYIGRHLDLSTSSVQRRGALQDASLDSTLDESGDDSRLEQLVDDAPSPESVVGDEEHDEKIRSALGRLRKRLGDVGWDVLQRRLMQDEPATLQELGNRWGVSRERVRQVEVMTRALLARYLEPIVEVAR